MLQQIFGDWRVERSEVFPFQISPTVKKVLIILFFFSVSDSIYFKEVVFNEKSYLASNLLKKFTRNRTFHIFCFTAVSYSLRHPLEICPAFL